MIRTPNKEKSERRIHNDDRQKVNKVKSIFEDQTHRKERHAVNIVLNQAKNADTEDSIGLSKAQDKGVLKFEIAS